MIDLDKIIIDKNSNMPAHKHIVKYIRSQINSDILKPGERLPPLRDFVKQVGIGSKTISDAIEALRKEGLIETSRKGSFIRKVPAETTEHPISAKKLVMMMVPDVSTYEYSSLVSGVNRRDNISDTEFVLKNIDETTNQYFDSCVVDALYHKYCGIIMVPPIESKIPANRFLLLQNNNIPVVFCHRKIEGISCPFVTWKWEDVGKTVARILTERKHRKIAYLASVQYEISKSYEKSLKEALQDNSIEFMENNVFYGATPRRDIYSERAKISFITKILSSPDRPTAIFCNDASSELLVFMIAETLHIKIPEELSLLRFGDHPHNTLQSNLISYIYVDHKKIGEIAKDLLIEMQNGSRSIDNSEVIYVPITFNEGQTLADAPTS